MFAVSDHGVSRVDELTVTPATASVPSGPTSLTITPGSTTRGAGLDGQRERQPDLVHDLPRHQVRRRGQHARRHRERHDHDVHRHRPDERENVLLQRRREQQRRRVSRLERGVSGARRHRHRALGAFRSCCHRRHRLGGAGLDRHLGRHQLQHLPGYRSRRGRRHAGRHGHVSQLHRQRAGERHHLLLHDHREQCLGHLGALR